MKNTKKGFVLPVLILIMFLSIASAGTYFYVNNEKSKTYSIDSKDKNVDQSVTRDQEDVISKNDEESEVSPEKLLEQKQVTRSKSTNAKKPFTTIYTTERLSVEHDEMPSSDKWKELTRILLYAPDSDMIGPLESDFAMHAGIKEIGVLLYAYNNPTENQDEDARQRILNIVLSLQGAPSQVEWARKTFSNQSKPISDHFILASAVVLARNGEISDIEAIFKRLNTAGNDTEPRGSLYSEADGLMDAISLIYATPKLEPFLINEALGKGVGTTNRSRISAISALRNFHTVPVTEVLYKLSKNDPDLLVKNAAQRSLREIQTNE